MNSVILNTLRRGRIAAFSVVAATAMIATAHADNLVVNGSFEQPANAGSGLQVASNQYSGITLPGWSNVLGYVILGPSGGGNVLASPVPVSPDGGNILELDGSSGSAGSISQVINGLTVGASTTVSFEMAAGNYFFYPDTPTTEQLEVSLGGDSQFTPVLGPGSAVKDWADYSFTFVPTSTSETLSFLASGTPQGEPPMVLLDGVDVSNTTSPVPEPGSIVLLGTGVIGAAGAIRRKYFA